MTKRIAVVGASGRAGHHAVDLLTERGHEVVPVSRTHGVDVITGEGLAEALAGVDAIIDVATGPSPEEQPATEFFLTSARHLQAAGAPLIVVASIIGVDRSRGGYGAAKRAHERALLDGPSPVRILRAAQFHELVEQFLQWGERRGDVVVVPKMRTQIMAARTAAEALVDLTLAAEAPPVTEAAGPRVENLAALARLIAGDELRIEEASDPVDAEFFEGGALPGPDAILAGPTFAEWLKRERSAAPR
jgi:uncharacterized protein YbjT (DUF2867 family)